MTLRSEVKRPGTVLLQARAAGLRNALQGGGVVGGSVSVTSSLMLTPCLGRKVDRRLWRPRLASAVSVIAVPIAWKVTTRPPRVPPPIPPLPTSWRRMLWSDAHTDDAVRAHALRLRGHALHHLLARAVERLRELAQLEVLGLSAHQRAQAACPWPPRWPSSCRTSRPRRTPSSTRRCRAARCPPARASRSRSPTAPSAPGARAAVAPSRRTAVPSTTYSIAPSAPSRARQCAAARRRRRPRPRGAPRSARRPSALPRTSFHACESVSSSVHEEPPQHHRRHGAGLVAHLVDRAAHHLRQRLRPSWWHSAKPLTDRSEVNAPRAASARSSRQAALGGERDPAGFDRARATPLLALLAVDRLAAARGHASAQQPLERRARLRAALRLARSSCGQRCDPLVGGQRLALDRDAPDLALAKALHAPAVDASS